MLPISSCAGKAAVQKNIVFPHKQTQVFSSPLSSNLRSTTMGIKFSRKRDASVNGAEAAEEPTVAQPEEPEMQPGTTPEHDPDDKQDLDVVVMTPASPVAALPKEDCVWESKEVKEEDEAELKATPAPAPADPSVPEPDPATGALVCSTVTPAGPPVDPEPASEALGHKETFTIETIIEPIMSSPTVDELGDPAPGPGPDPAPGPGPEPTPASVNPDDDFHDKREETTESAGELVEAELAGSSQEVGNDVDQGGVEKLLENLELTESDLTADIIPADDTPDTHTWASMNTHSNSVFTAFLMLHAHVLKVNDHFLIHKGHKAKSKTIEHLVYGWGGVEGWRLHGPTLSE